MPRSLARLSYADLQAELRRRERASGTLAMRRDRLQAKLDALNAQIAQLGGTVNGSTRAGRRARNKMTLAEALAKAIGSRTMSVSDAIEAVQKLGYRTTSKSFRIQVNTALIKSGKFKRVGRGEYTAK